MTKNQDKIHADGAGRQQGVTLVELLVAVVIISVGLLGVAALHLTSLRNSYDSNSRSKAVWFAHDIADRMRANRDVARKDGYNIAIGASASGSTIAATDVQDWKTRLASSTGLPSGDGSISTTLVGNSIVFTITVQWKERDSKDPLQFVTQTEI